MISFTVIGIKFNLVCRNIQSLLKSVIVVIKIYEIELKMAIARGHVQDEDNKDQPMHAICRTYTSETKTQKNQGVVT